eukprot:m.17422 g.17422  ORF g.17422 m.17422 type:complete len:231 (-) comp10670_c0_seq1:173-865(-)
MNILDDSLSFPVQTAGLQLRQHLEQQPVYLVGHGASNGIHDVIQTQTLTYIVTERLSQDGATCVVYGGDFANPTAPDVGMVALWMASHKRLPLVMVQCDAHKDHYHSHRHKYGHVTAAQLYVTERCAQGNILYGGTDIDNNPVGTTRIVASCSDTLHAVVAFGGGPIAVQECEYFYQRGVPIMAVDVKPRTGLNLLTSWSEDKLPLEESEWGRVYKRPHPTDSTEGELKA